MQVYVELFGISRLVAGVKELSLELEDGTTFRDVARLLASRYPSMIGDVIQRDGQTLQSPNIFNLGGRRMIQADGMDDLVKDNDRIILMSMSAGG